MVYFDLIGVQTLKIIPMSDLKISGVSGFLFWAIESVGKVGTDGVFINPHSIVK